MVSDERIKVVILAGGKGEGLPVLCAERTVAAMPFGARYRLIDFPLSNCVHAGLYDIDILAQYSPSSLMEHIGSGRAWDLDRKYTGVRILPPIQTDSPSTWYRGTADALRQNLNEFRGYEFVLVLPGDSVFKIDFRAMLRQHHKRRAAITLATVVVDLGRAHRYGLAEVSDVDRITAFYEKPEHPKGTLASMAVYLFDGPYLSRKLEELPPDRHDLVRDVIVPAVDEGVVHQYPFNSYWEDVGELATYYQANLALLEDTPRLAMADPARPVMTPTDEMPPAKFGPESHVERSLVANGSIINGKVVNSLVSRGVYVESGALVKDSILFGDTLVRSGAVIDRAIVDTDCRIAGAAVVGGGDVLCPNERFPDVFSGGLTVIGRGNSIPAGCTIGRHVCLAPASSPAEGEHIPCGSCRGELE